jgi:hypothetical protein
MGLDIARAALAAGHAVVATGRNTLLAQAHAHRELSASLAHDDV